MTGLTLRMQAVPLASPAATEVLVVAEVEGGPLGFSREGDRHVGHLELALLDISAGGRPGGVHQQRFAMRLTASELERVRNGGVRAVWRVPLPPGRHHLRLAAHDRRSGRAGSVTVDVDVLGANPDAPALAGVLLTSDGARAALTPHPDSGLAALLPNPPTAADRFFDDETLSGVALGGRASQQRTGFAGGFGHDSGWQIDFAVR